MVLLPSDHEVVGNATIAGSGTALTIFGTTSKFAIAAQPTLLKAAERRPPLFRRRGSEKPWRQRRANLRPKARECLYGWLAQSFSQLGLTIH